MKKYLALLSVLISAVAFAISIDVDLLKSPDHTKVWTPPSTSTTLVGRDTVDNLSNKTLDKLVSTSEQNNNTVTGANAVMTTPTSLVVQVSNGSLTSIDGVTAPSDNQIFVLKNKTGSNVTINNETGVNTTYRIKTGTGANLVMATDSAIILSYSITDSRWQVIGGSGSGSGSGISSWVTANGYLAGDLVIQSNKIYQAQSDHTSGTFATDLSGGKWAEISAPQDLTGPISSTSGVTSITSQTGTGTKFVVDTSPTIVTPTISGHPTVEGVTATGATGTGKFVFDTSPTLVTPTLGVATATSINGTTIPSSKTLQDKDTLTAKGDLYVATASATTARQAVGSNTQVLTADSSQTNGIKWADSQILTKSEVEGADVSAVKIITPNAQLTTTSTGIRRLETSNTNLMLNPSFEASTVSTDHTLTNATAANDTTNKTDGAKGIAVTVTSSGGGISQTSTTNAASLAGSQGVVKASVYTTGTDVYVCPLMAGSPPSDIAKYCGNVPKSTTSVKMPEVIVPFIMDGTSNGYKIYSTGASAFTADEVFVGKAAPFQNVNGAKQFGVLKYGTAANCAWQNTSTSFANFAADTDCATPTVTGQVKAPSTKIPAFVIPQGSPAGTYKFIAVGGFYRDNVSPGFTAWRFSDGTNSSSGGSTYGANSMVPVIEGQITYSSSFTTDTTINIQGKVVTNTQSIEAPPASDGLEIQVWYFPPESKIYSQASQDVAYQPCTFSTLAWQGLGTVTNNLLCARKGQNLLMKGRVTLGTVAAAQAQIPLPTNFGTITTASNIPSTPYASGFVLREASSANTIYSLIQLPSVSYLAMAGQLGNTTINPNSPLNGSAMFSNSDILSIPEIAIPIQGWSDYGVIVGSFAGIEKCANDYECTDTFSATIDSSGNISNENIDWLSGTTCPISGQGRLCTYQTFLKDGISGLSSPMNCVAMQGYDPTTANAGEQGLISSTTTGVNISNTVSGVGNNVSGFSIKCQKGANDYKPKTAKVASSIGIPTVPGITTLGTGNLIDTFSVSYAQANAGTPSATVCSTNSSNCASIDQIGTAVVSIAKSQPSGTLYTMNTVKTYISLKCGLKAQLASSEAFETVVQCKSCNSVSFRTTNIANTINSDSYGTLLCQGSY